ncbi:MAG: lytic transglycosylase domain-containing protein [Candidatus Dormibacter sp.]
MSRRFPTLLTAVAVATALCACATATRQAPDASVHPSVVAARTTPSASPVATPTASPAATPVSAQPVGPAPADLDAAYVANELGGVEAGIRTANTPAFEYVGLGRRQQQMYHLLATRPNLVPGVLAAVAPPVQAAIQANLSAARQIDSLNGSRSQLPHWRIVAPPPPEVLLGYYREAEAAFGIRWQYLAAINLIETNMGRIQGLSSAGAQGPMQFMPPTWATYGRGDVNNPRDAILAAGRYLQAAGAARDLNRAIYAYNNSTLYVQAVTQYAQQMLGNERTFLSYYNWQVYVATNGGDVLLPEGFSN